MALISNSLAPYGQLGQSASSSTSTFGSAIAAGSGLSNWTTTQLPNYTYPPVQPPDPPAREVKFPLLYEGTQDGVFIVGRDGKRHWVPIEKIALSIGLEW